jgi:hypothetical protein
VRGAGAGRGAGFARGGERFVGLGQRGIGGLAGGFGGGQRGFGLGEIGGKARESLRPVRFRRSARPAWRR